MTWWVSCLPLAPLLCHLACFRRLLPVSWFSTGPEQCLHLPGCLSNLIFPLLQELCYTDRTRSLYQWLWCLHTPPCYTFHVGPTYCLSGRVILELLHGVFRVSSGSQSYLETCHPWCFLITLSGVLTVTTEVAEKPGMEARELRQSRV